MIDFSKYTLQELQAISDALDTMIDDIIEHDLSVSWVFTEYRNAREAEAKKIAEHVRKAEEKLAALQARDAAEPASVPADDPPEIKCANIDRCGVCLAYCPLYEPAADPPAPPDMFGWVGDAIDDLCAAGEATGNDR